MNLAVFSVKNSRIAYTLMVMIILGGLVSYVKMGRLEDPEFTIKEAVIVTNYPGASAEQVAKEVTNVIENAVQQLGQLKRVESISVRGRSIVSAMIEDRFHRAAIPQVWDELRRKINDVVPRLPPSARGTTLIIDDFGDVYGVFLAITGDGYTTQELRRYVESVRRELQLVGDVKKVELFGEQREVVFLEISRQRLAQLGINEDTIYAQLQAKNISSESGRIRVGPEFIAIDPQGAFGSQEEMLGMVIGSDESGRQLFLKDVATITRGYEEPPRRILRFDGKVAVGLGVSTVQGGNVVKMGEGVRKKLEQLRATQPVGIDIGEINFQPTAVTEATNEFIFNLIKAVSIVVIVLLFAMGVRAGLLIGIVLLITILATLQIMFLYDILLERISLGAFIIALCMLTDNAIVVTEVIKVRIEAGEDKLEVVRDAVAQNQWPLFFATSIAVIAFAAIGLSEDSTGEYCNSLFWVIAISLGMSWLAAITFTPLLAYVLFKPRPAGQEADDPYKSPLFKVYRVILVQAIRFRWPVIALAALLFVAGGYGFRFVEQSFFPPATRPQFLVDAYLPSGTHVRDSEAFAGEIQRYLAAQPGVTHVSAFIGGGGLRFLLVYSPEPENRAFVQFLVNVDDEKKIQGLREGIQAYLDDKYPDANAIAKNFLLGPGKGGRIQARFQGPDPERLRQLADQAKAIFVADGNALCIRDDWREREKVVRPELSELAARRLGITRADVAQALETSFQGRTVGFYREPGDVGGGLYPQESRLLPIIARPPEAERANIADIENIHIWSPSARRMIPLSQVVPGVEVGWEDSAIARRDRFATITVHADPRTGLPSALFNRVREKIQNIEMPEGYSMQWGGEYEDSGNARAALAASIPATMVLMAFFVLCVFNSIRSTIVICMTVPLIIIGITAGMLITGAAFGFMALLGAIALAGEQIKNSIVLVDEFGTQKELGKSPYLAVVDGAVGRLRPVLLVVVTTVLGMIPLLSDPFFSAMAVTIMFGLAFAAVLTMIVVPVLFTIFFRIQIPSGSDPTPAPSPSPAPSTPSARPGTATSLPTAS